MIHTSCRLANLECESAFFRHKRLQLTGSIAFFGAIRTSVLSNEVRLLSGHFKSSCAFETELDRSLGASIHF